LTPTATSAGGVATSARDVATSVRIATSEHAVGRRIAESGPTARLFIARLTPTATSAGDVATSGRIATKGREAANRQTAITTGEPPPNYVIC